MSKEISRGRKLIRRGVAAFGWLDRAFGETTTGTLVDSRIEMLEKARTRLEMAETSKINANSVGLSTQSYSPILTLYGTMRQHFLIILKPGQIYENLISKFRSQKIMHSRLYNVFILQNKITSLQIELSEITERLRMHHVV